MKKIKIRINGRGWEENNSLPDLIETLNSFQKIVDGAWLVVNNRQRMTYGERQQFTVRVNNYKLGSFEADLFLHFAQVPLILGISNPGDLWDLVKNSFEVMKFVGERLTKKTNRPRL